MWHYWRSEETLRQLDRQAQRGVHPNERGGTRRMAHPRNMIRTFEAFWKRGAVRENLFSGSEREDAAKCATIACFEPWNPALWWDSGVTPPSVLGAEATNRCEVWITIVMTITISADSGEADSHPIKTNMIIKPTPLHSFTSSSLSCYEVINNQSFQLYLFSVADWVTYCVIGFSGCNYTVITPSDQPLPKWEVLLKVSSC